MDLSVGRSKGERSLANGTGYKKEVNTNRKIPKPKLKLGFRLTDHCIMMSRKIA